MVGDNQLNLNAKIVQDTHDSFAFGPGPNASRCSGTCAAGRCTCCLPIVLVTLHVLHRARPHGLRRSCFFRCPPKRDMLRCENRMAHLDLVKSPVQLPWHGGSTEITGREQLWLVHITSGRLSLGKRRRRRRREPRTASLRAWQAAARRAVAGAGERKCGAQWLG